jgi:hypothetical protein
MMKINSVFAILIAFFSLFSQVNAEEIQINSDTGETRVLEDNWRPLTNSEEKAYKKPGKKIPVLFEKSFERSFGSFREFFYVTEVVHVSQAIIVEDMRLRKIYEPYVFMGESYFLWYIPLMILIVSLMVISNVCFKKGYLDSLPLSLAIIAAIFTVPFTLFSFTTLFTVLAAALALLLVYASDTNRSNQRRGYVIFSSIFYVCALASLFV